MIAPSLTLVRSKVASTRETGVSRVSRWHSSDAALPTVVAQGGAEALLAALPSAQPETRVTILELLLRMVPLADAQARLISNDAATVAAQSCTSDMPPADGAVATQRCRTLADELARSLSR